MKCGAIQPTPHFTPAVFQTPSRVDFCIGVAGLRPLERIASFGDGPVDAALKTIKEITGIQCTLTSYVVKAITGGTDAQGEVSVGVEKDGVRITGRGAHTDIVVASALAFLNALNRLAIRSKGLSPATPIQKSALGGV